MPIFGPTKEIVGVTNLINKKNGDQIVSFTKEDEQLFEAFSSFCGLALHKTLLFEEIKTQRQKLEISLELMSYHYVAKPEDVARFSLSVVPQSVVPISRIRSHDFDTHIFGPTDDRLVSVVCSMFEELGFPTRFALSEEKIALYTLTVRKNYRLNEYHNFTHASAVVHGMFLLISRNILEPFGIDFIDAFGMFIAALNHDIDHRGTNNQFQKTVSSALASFYSTSTMERHHFNQFS